MTDREYVVVNEETLAYTLSGDRNVGIFAGILATRSISRDPRLDGSFYISPNDTMRPATLEDFERFRVQPSKEFAEQCRKTNPEWGKW